VDPVPDPLLLRKCGSAGNRTLELWICSQELWPLDHRGGRSSLQVYVNSHSKKHVTDGLHVVHFRPATFSKKLFPVIWLYHVYRLPHSNISDHFDLSIFQCLRAPFLWHYKFIRNSYLLSAFGMSFSVRGRERLRGKDSVPLAIYANISPHIASNPSLIVGHS
jgi:hypothetical protein